MLKKGILVFVAIISSWIAIDELDAQHGCPLSKEAVPYVENVVFNFLLDTLFVAGGAGITPNGTITKAHIPYASTLPGKISFEGRASDAGVRAFQSLTALCTEPIVFERSCRSQEPEAPNEGFWKNQDVCIQLRCEAKGIYKTEIIWVEKEASIDEPHPFGYLTNRRAEIHYDVNPKTTWRVDAANLKKLVITGETFAAVKVKTSAGTSLDLTHNASVTATANQNDGLSSIVYHVVFPSLRTPVPIRAELLLHRHSDSFASGSIAAGTRILATLKLEPGQPPSIEWTDACN